MTEKNMIRQLMKIRNISQADLAELSGFKSQANITAFLNMNKRGIRADKYMQLLRGLGCVLKVCDANTGEEIEINDRVEGRNERDVVKALMEQKGLSMQKLADFAGLKHHTNVSWYLNGNRNGLRMDILLNLLNAMGCALVVRDKERGEEWELDDEDIWVNE